MTRKEFAKIAVYIGCACGGKYLDEEALTVYFDLLGDLQYETLLVGAKRVLLERVYPNFPTAGELRHAAAATPQGPISELTPIEAWAIGSRVFKNTDPEIPGSFEHACRDANAPAIVIQTIKALGLPSLCYGREPIGVVRAQFTRAYEQMAARAKTAALLPEKLKTSIEQQHKTPLQSSIHQLTAGIGKMSKQT